MTTPTRPASTGRYSTIFLTARNRRELTRTQRDGDFLQARPDPQPVRPPNRYATDNVRTASAIQLRATKLLPGFPTEEDARRFLDEECRKSTEARLRELEGGR